MKNRYLIALNVIEEFDHTLRIWPQETLRERLVKMSEAKTSKCLYCWSDELYCWCTWDSIESMD